MLGEKGLQKDTKGFFDVQSPGAAPSNSSKILFTHESFPKIFLPKASAASKSKATVSSNFCSSKPPAAPEELLGRWCRTAPFANGRGSRWLVPAVVAVRRELRRARTLREAQVGDPALGDAASKVKGLTGERLSVPRPSRRSCGQK